MNSLFCCSLFAMLVIPSYLHYVYKIMCLIFTVLTNSCAIPLWYILTITHTHQCWCRNTRFLLQKAFCNTQALKMLLTWHVSSGVFGSFGSRKWTSLALAHWKVHAALRHRHSASVYMRYTYYIYLYIHTPVYPALVVAACLCCVCASVYRRTLRW